MIPQRAKQAGVSNIDELAINTIRCLAIDGVQKANSGHPGTPLGAAPDRLRSLAEGSALRSAATLVAQS